MNGEDERDEASRIEASVNRRFYLPRLGRSAYQGPAVVHWTLTMESRASGWLTPGFHAAFRELMLHAAAREGLFCPAYCLMPDHLHFIWMGLKPASDQRNGMAFLRTHLKRQIAPARFQRQAHDHVLTSDERRRDTFAKACLYGLANPVRAGLVARSEDWEYLGAIIPGYPTLHPLEEHFWRRFWELYWKEREAGEP